MLGPVLRQAFEERGLLRMPGLLPSAVTDPVRSELHALLERRGVWRDGGWSGGLAGAEQTGRLRKAIRDRMKASAACPGLQTTEIAVAVDELLDHAATQTFSDRPQVLFTPPDSRTWAVPHKVWHLDVPRLGRAECPGVQMFCCLDPVAAHGGGTVVVAGSHRLLNDQGRLASRDVKRRLGRLPWFQQLFRPGDGERDRMLMADTPETADVPLQVVEITGEPGDVYLMDVRVLHSLAPNASASVRLMATHRYFRKGLAVEFYRPSAA